MGKQVNFTKTLIIIFISLLIALSAVTVVALAVTSNKKRKHLEEYYAEVNRQSIAVETDKKLIANKTNDYTYIKPGSNRGFEEYYLEEGTIGPTSHVSTSATRVTTVNISTTSKTIRTTIAKPHTVYIPPTVKIITTKTTTTTTNSNYDYEYDNMDTSEIDDIYDDDYFAEDNPDIVTEIQENISESY